MKHVDEEEDFSIEIGRATEIEQEEKEEKEEQEKEQEKGEEEHKKILTKIKGSHFFYF